MDEQIIEKVEKIEVKKIIKTKDVEEKIYIEPEKEIEEPTKFDLFLDRLSKNIKDFFAKNTLAKI
jgi:hypothetical protein